MAVTVDGLFLSALQEFPERPFLRRRAGSQEERLSYAQAAGRVAATVRRLSSLGYRSGDRVVAYADDMVPCLFFILACAHAGIVVAPLAPGFSVDAVDRLRARIQARGVFTTLAHVPRLRARGGTPLAFVEPRGGADGVLPLPAGEAAPPAEAAALLREAAAGHGPEDPFVLLPTSGTTGEPKLPVRTHGAQARRTALFATSCSARRDEPGRFLLIAALTHSFGHTVLATGLRVAAEFCVPGAIDTQASLSEVRALDPTHVFATPRVLRAFRRQQEDDPAAGERLFGPAARVLRLTGSASDEPLMRELLRHGVDVGESYGASECGAIALTPPGGWRPGFVGRIFPGIDVKLAQDGEVLVRVPGEAVDYYGDPDQSRAARTADGFYETGDCGEITPDGYLRIRGRKRDVFNTAEGSNVYPQRIEALIEALPWVSQAVLIGDQRPYFAALIVVREGLPLPGGDGGLDTRAFAGLYERARADLARVNSGLEAIERVRAFRLLARPFAPELYAPVQAGKARRDRKAIESAYAPRIEELYAGLTPALSVAADAAAG